MTSVVAKGKLCIKWRFSLRLNPLLSYRQNWISVLQLRYISNGKRIKIFLSVGLGGFLSSAKMSRVPLDDSFCYARTAQAFYNHPNVLLIYRASTLQSLY